MPRSVNIMRKILCCEFRLRRCRRSTSHRNVREIIDCEQCIVIVIPSHAIYKYISWEHTYIDQIYTWQFILQYIYSRTKCICICVHSAFSFNTVAHQFHSFREMRINCGTRINFHSKWIESAMNTIYYEILKWEKNGVCPLENALFYNVCIVPILIVELS